MCLIYLKKVQEKKKLFAYELRNKDGDIEDNKIISRQLPFFVNKNIYVFINNNTMSVSEYIVASGIKLAFAKKSILFLEKTFGMSGQARIYQINKYVQLYMTEKRYMLLGSKKEIQQGIEPDYHIKYSGEDITKEDYFVKWYKNNKEKL